MKQFTENFPVFNKLFATLQAHGKTSIGKNQAWDLVFKETTNTKFADLVKAAFVKNQMSVADLQVVLIESYIVSCNKIYNNILNIATQTFIANATACYGIPALKDICNAIYKSCKELPELDEHRLFVVKKTLIALVQFHEDCNKTNCGSRQTYQKFIEFLAFYIKQANTTK